MVIPHCSTVLIYLILSLFVLLSNSLSGNVPKYSVIVDAGSTGTRTFVFMYNPEGPSMDHVTSFPCGRVKLGLSQFYGNESAAVNMFMPMIVRAAEIIPTEYHPSTPLIVKGTAGMRLLAESKQEILWEALFNGFQRSGAFPFELSRSNFGTISGHLEAYYAVVASNYLVGSIDAQLRLINTTNVIGALDMGGGSNQLIMYMGGNERQGIQDGSAQGGDGSTQTAISQNASDSSANQLKASQFWSHSWLKYGAEIMTTRINDWLWSQHEEKTQRASSKHRSSEMPLQQSTHETVVIENPCTQAEFMEELWLPNNTAADISAAEAAAGATNTEGPSVAMTTTGRPSQQRIQLVGTGKPQECVRILETVLWGAPLTGEADDEEVRYDSVENEAVEQQLASPSTPETAEPVQPVEGAEVLLETTIDFVGNADKGPLRPARQPVNMTEVRKIVDEQILLSPSPRPVDNIQLPPVSGQRFYAMSVYFYALDCIRALMGGSDDVLPHWPTPSIAELEDITEDFCELPWPEVRARYSATPHPFTGNTQLSQRCTQALYILTLWEKGFGFHRHDRAVTLAYEIEGKEVEWTLGFLLAEVLTK